jgi:hypothetical protein
MTWSYDESLPTDRDKVRFRIGDIDTEEQLLSNETLDTLLTIRDDVVLASIDAVEGILAKFAREIDRQALGLGGPRSQKTLHYRELLKELRAEAARSSTGIFFGGGSLAQKDAILSNPDAPKAPFRLNQWKNNED